MVLTARRPRTEKTLLWGLSYQPDPSTNQPALLFD